MLSICKMSGVPTKYKSEVITPTPPDTVQATSPSQVPKQVISVLVVVNEITDGSVRHTVSEITVQVALTVSVITA